MKKKIILSLVFLLLIISGNCSLAFDSYFVDTAKVTSSEEQLYLNSIARKASQESGMDIACVITNNFAGKTAMEYADDYFDYNGYGQGEKRSGIILVINPKTRDYHISTSGDAIKIFSKNNFKRLKSDFIGDLSNQRYKKAVENYIKSSESIIKNSNMPIPLKNVGFIFLFSVILGSVISYFMVVNIKNRENYTVKPNNSAILYMDQKIRFENAADVFLYRTISRTRRQEDIDRGETYSPHQGSSGNDHGGYGGKF